MDVTFDKINNGLTTIVSDFESLLASGNYDEAKAAVEKIANILDSSSNIEISNGNSEEDNSFHKLYEILKEKVDSRASSPAAQAPGNTTDFSGLQRFLKDMSDNLFYTHKVRSELIKKNPEMDVYKAALEEGVTETNERKNTLQTQKSMYQYVEKNVFIDSSVNPPIDRRTLIENNKKIRDGLKEVSSKFDEISTALTWFADPTNPDPSATRNEIDTKKNEIKTIINDLVANNSSFDINDLFTSGTLDDYLDDANISGSKATADSTVTKAENELVTQCTAVKTQIDNIKSGSVTLLDSNGNPLNLQDLEIVRKFDTSTLDFVADLDGGITKINNFSTEIVSKPAEIDAELQICDQEIQIFKDHIKVIDYEITQLARDPNDRQMYLDEMDNATKQSIQAEKDEKFQDAKDKFYGDANKHKQYKAAWKRFKSHRRPVTETITVNGRRVQFTYMGLSDYTEKDADLKFMQLESWEERSRRVALADELTRGLTDPDDITRALASAYRNTRIEELENLIALANSDGDAYTSYTGRSLTPAEISEMQKELADQRERVHAQLVRDKDYVKNYNSSHFDVKDTVAIALTGGSAMRARNNQNKGKMTLADGLAAFFGVTPYDVKADGKRHVVRTTIANIFGIVSTPARALKVAWGLAVGGVTWAIGKATGTYDMPTPYKVGHLDRREARREYYRNHGSTRLGAWFKGIFNLNVRDENGNKVKLNDKLIADRCLLIGQSIEDTYIRGAREKLIDDQIRAERNKRIRQAAYQNQARSAEIYEDIYLNNPESIYGNQDERDKIANRAMQRAALQFGSQSTGPITNVRQSFVTDGKSREGKFVPEVAAGPLNNLNMNITDKLDFSDRIGEAVWTNAISRENMQRARTRGMDFALRLACASTLPAFKGMLSKFTVKAFKKPDEFVPPRIITENQDIITKGKRPVIGMKTVNYTETHTEDISMDNLTFGDIQRGDTAYWSADLGEYSGSHAHGIFSDAATEVQGAHFHFTDPLTNQTYEFSFSPKSYERYINSHNLNPFSTEYHDNISFGADDNIVDSVVEHMPKEMGDAYKRFLEEASKNGTFEEAFKNSTQFAYGIPSQATENMGQGWSETIFDAVTKEVTEDKTKYIRGIVGYEDYEFTVTKPVQKVIEGYIKKGSYVSIPGGCVVGAADMLLADLKQALAPVFRKGKRNTKNHHETTKIGREDFTGNAVRDRNMQADYDMFESSLDENNNPYLYESAKSRKDKSLNATQHKGTPIIPTDSNGNPIRRDPYDQDDFEL